MPKRRKNDVFAVEECIEVIGAGVFHNIRIQLSKYCLVSFVTKISKTVIYFHLMPMLATSTKGYF